MQITLPPDLSEILTKAAAERGVTPEELAVKELRSAFPKPPEPIPHEEFIARLRAAASDCGVSLPDSALTSEELYD